MRVALFADIHANREAFSACLADAARRGHDRVAVLGDIVGYGADPAWAIDTVQSLVTAGAIAVRGNHDAAVAGDGDRMSADAAQAVAWTRAKLDAPRRAFLAGLPLTHVEDAVLFVHANGWAPSDWGYVRTTVEAERSMRAIPQRITLCGHTHVPALFHMSPLRPAGRFEPVPGRPVPMAASHRWLGVIGSVGQPRDGVPAACYAMLDLSPGPSPSLTIHRVPYAAEDAARKIRAAGLPASLADRLLHGR